MGKVYPEEFRRQAVELYRLDDDASYADIARDMGCSSESVRAWVRQAQIDDGERDGTTSQQRERECQLERRVARLEKENKILKMAAAYFANEVTR